MAVKTMDAVLLKKLFLAGAAGLEAKKDYINELNVFPVPDGDTGTNMTMTIMSAAKEIEKIDKPDMATVCKAMSSGSLRGARGNSGVILSQLLRGFTKEIKECSEVDVSKLALAFERAVNSAYKAVMKPKEGTILTVAKAGAQKAAEIADSAQTIEEFGEQVIAYMEEVLLQTPDMLPVLKEAGVVDSGGQGLLEVMKGAYNALIGKVVVYDTVSAKEEEVKYNYSVEFVIVTDKTFNKKSEIEFKEYLAKNGKGDLKVASGSAKVSSSTDNPGLVIEKAITYGQIKEIKVENLNIGSDSTSNTDKAPAKKQPRKKVGFVSVSVGEGINDIFKELGVDFIIEGGQTMNPSTDDIMSAIEQVNADTVFILPNNGNIILAAEQAKSLTKDKEIVVVPTKTVPQGITAVINYVEDRTAEENLKAMQDEIVNVKTGQVTYAVRNTTMDGVEIKENDIMGLDGKNILAVGSDISDVTAELVDKLVDDDSELVSIYYGEDISEEDANKLADVVSSKHKDVDVEVNFGGQPVYYYLISVE